MITSPPAHPFAVLHIPSYQRHRTIKKLQQLLLIAGLACTAGGCVSTVVGVAGAAVKGTVKGTATVGAGAAKVSGKAVGALVSSDHADDESEGK